MVTGRIAEHQAAGPRAKLQGGIVAGLPPHDAPLGASVVGCERCNGQACGRRDGDRSIGRA